MFDRKRISRPLSYKTKTTYVLKTKTSQVKIKTTFLRTRPLFEDHQIIAQDLKIYSPTEKIRPVMPVLPSHAGIILEPKNMLFTSILLKFCFIPKLGS